MDSKLSRIQAAVLAIGRPTLSAWQGLGESGLYEDPDMVVPAAKVLNFCQRTLCLVGNTSEFITQERCTKILEAVDPSWAKYMGLISIPKQGKTCLAQTSRRP